MIERPSAGLPEATPAAASSRAAGGEAEAEIARRAQFLTTEHWSLLATRSMSWNEAFSRTSMFLSTLSAATVALALAGPVMAFGGFFPLFALVVLSVTLFLGIATYVRLVQVNNEDLLWVFGMNRLRGAYTRISPGLEKDLIAGWTVDPRGIARTFGAIDVTSDPSPLHALLTTPAVVGVISSAIGGVIAGLVATQIGVDQSIAIGVGIVAFLVAVVLMLAYGMREYTRFVARMAVEHHDEALAPEAVPRSASNAADGSVR
jgi:hypothetical protein